MSGKGNCYHNAAAETFFKTIKGALIRRRSWKQNGRPKPPFSNISTAFTLRAVGIRLWEGKARWLSNARRHRQALGVAPNRERSTPHFHDERKSAIKLAQQLFWATCHPASGCSPTGCGGGD